MKNIFKCLMIIIGTLIGAGFASGQEIASFFNRFLNDGLIGILVMAVLFGVVIYLIMRYSNKLQIIKYEELIKENKIALYIMKAFTFICFCIMISAIGSYGEEQFGFSFWIGAVFAGVICLVLFLFKFNGLEKINNILVPFILVGIALLSFTKFDSTLVLSPSVKEYSSFFTNNWFISALLYVGYNSILLLPILVEFNNYKLKNKDIFILSILASLFIGIAGVLIYKSINIYFPDILNLELPTLVVAKTCGAFIGNYYSIVILFAIFTTAFSCGYSFLKMNSEKNYLRNASIICVAGVILSRIGFSDMINFFFPLFGYLGVLQIVIIFLCNRKKVKRTEEK